MVYEKYDIDSWMSPIWKGDTTVNETVLFVGDRKEAKLLYDIDKIVSVRTSDLQKEYKAGVDFDVKDGILVKPEGSTIVVATEDYYYSSNPGAPQVVLLTKRDGVDTNTIYDEAICRFQTAVTYTHKNPWDGFIPQNQSERFEKLIKKLENGEDATIMFYGDSITYGACSSALQNFQPNAPSWALMFTNYLAKQFDCGVRYVKPELDGVCQYVCNDFKGKKGTITYVNVAVGGWQVTDGIEKFDLHVKAYVEKYGCDFFLMGFGMNDAFRDPDNEMELQKQILDRVIELAPNVEILLLATMVPNPEATNGWYGKQELFEPYMANLADEYTKKGTNCGIAKMTSMSKQILGRKRFRDYTGNNINHPNDFMARVYAQTVYETVIGY